MNQRHKNADVIIAFAKGKIIQWRLPGNENWHEIDHLNGINDTDIEWRIKPEKKKLWLATDGVRVILGVDRKSAISNFRNAHERATNLLHACIEIEYEEGQGL